MASLICSAALTFTGLWRFLPATTDTYRRAFLGESMRVIPRASCEYHTTFVPHQKSEQLMKFIFKGYSYVNIVFAPKGTGKLRAVREQGQKHIDAGGHIKFIEYPLTDDETTPFYRAERAFTAKFGVQMNHVSDIYPLLPPHSFIVFHPTEKMKAAGSLRSVGEDTKFVLSQCRSMAKVYNNGKIIFLTSDPLHAKEIEDAPTLSLAYRADPASFEWNEEDVDRYLLQVEKESYTFESGVKDYIRTYAISAKAVGFMADWRDYVTLRLSPERRKFISDSSRRYRNDWVNLNYSTGSEGLLLSKSDSASTKTDGVI